MIDKDMIECLIENAMRARAFSYSPYSHYQVGAALLARNGTIYTGANIENAAYSPTNCAERSAFFSAVSEGIREFAAIAVIGGPEDEPVRQYAWPCGVCRQVMLEFCDPQTFQVISAKSPEEYEVRTLDALVPYGFGAGNLSDKDQD